MSYTIEQLDCAVSTATADLRAEVGRLTKELRIAELKASGTLANNLCPDHRDKQVGKPCLACEIERLRSALQHIVEAEGTPLSDYKKSLQAWAVASDALEE